MLSFKTHHFLTGEELSQKELLALLDSAELLKKTRSYERPQTLLGKSIALIFEKPSLRTRVSFTVGIQELGGSVMELSSGQKKNEDPEDAIRVLQGLVHGVMLRTFEHDILERMVSKATVPVINGLSDLHHPCQALADLLTLREHFGSLQGLKLAYVGDGNNVLHSLLLLLPFVGVDVHYACPEGFEPSAEVLARAQKRAVAGGAQIKKFDKPQEAVADVQAIYTDVWTSMGSEILDSDLQQARLEIFKDYQVNAELAACAAPHALIMHCLPMNKGQEITGEMIELPQSMVFAQAENRLHAQKALLMGLYQGMKGLH